MKNLKLILVFSSIIGLLSLIYTIYQTDEPFLFILSILYIMGGLWLYKSNEERFFYFFSLNVALFFLPILTHSYLQQTGSPFIPGGDAQTYYEKVMEMLRGDFSRFYGRYKLYLYVGWKFYEIINIFTTTTSYIYFVFLNIFIGANISPLLYKVGKRISKNETLIYACLMTSLFPLIIQVTDGTWREGFIYAPFLYSIYLAINLKNTKYLLFFFITFLFIINIRMEVGIASLIFFILYNYVFLDKYGKTNKPYINKSISIGALIIGIMFCLYIGLFEYLNYSTSASLEYQIEAYNEASNEMSEGNSIANTLRNMGFLGKLLLFFYSLFSPIPPPAFTVPIPYFHYYFISLGSIIWYFVFPVSIFGLIKELKNKELLSFVKSLLITLVFGIGIISITTVGTARHKLYLYPLLFLFYFHTISNLSPKEIFKLYSKIIVVYLGGFLLYLYIKY